MAYPTVTRERLIVDWFNRSQMRVTPRSSIFDKFMSLWVAFNAWGTYQSKKGKDAEMLSWIKINTDLPRIHAELMKDNEDYRYKVVRLAQYEVLDMRPGHEGQSKSINDINSFDQLLDVIYQIRCNLFHGQKSEIDPHDCELVDLAFHILSKVFKYIVLQIK